MNILYYSLLVGILYVLWRYTSKARKHRQCVDEEVMVAYRKGRLKDGDADYDHLLGHLGVCEKCRDKMGDF